jgi:tetratricopeptide (TPR) repeat protein
VAARVGVSPIRNALVAAVDDWAGKSHGAKRSWLLEVARGADPHPIRDGLRDPTLWDDPTALARQAGAADVRVVSPQFLAVVAQRVRYAGGDAVPLLLAAQPRYPDDFWINFELGRAFSDGKRIAEAIGYYRAAQALRPDSRVATGGLSAELTEQGSVDEARACIGSYLERHPGDAEVQFSFGIALHRKGQLDKAIAAYRQAITLDPKDIRFYDGLGIALSAKGQPDAAIAEFRKAIEIDPKDRIARVSLGLALEKKGLLDEAIAVYRKAIEIDPKFAFADYYLVTALDEKGEVDEAFVVLDEALRRMPAEVALWRLRAEFRVARKQYREAAADFAEASRLQPDDPTIWGRCAIACLGARDPEGFRRTCPGMLKACGRLSSPKARNWISWTAFRGPDAMSDFGPLLKLQEEVLQQQTDAKDPILWYYQMTYGAILCRAGQHEKSVQQLTASCQLHPQGGNGYDWFFLALAHHHLGHSEEALRWLGKAFAWMDRASGGTIQDAYIPIPLAWMDRVTMEILFDEAESLIVAKGGR